MCRSAPAHGTHTHPRHTRPHIFHAYPYDATWAWLVNMGRFDERQFGARARTHTLDAHAHTRVRIPGLPSSGPKASASGSDRPIRIVSERAFVHTRASTCNWLPDLRVRLGRVITCTHCTRRRRISRPSRRDPRRPLPCFARHLRKAAFGHRRRMVGEVFNIPGKRDVSLGLAAAVRLAR